MRSVPLLLVPVFFSCAGTTTGTSTTQGTPVQVIMVDVGQGDSTLVIGTDGTVVLVDGGGIGRGAAVRAAVEAETGGRVDHVVVTHFDADHLAGIAEFLAGPDGMGGTADDGAPDALLWDYGDESTCSSQTCTRYRALRTGRALVMSPGEAIPLGDAALDCMAVNGRVADGTTVAMPDENGRSIAFVLRHGAFRAFLGGDLTGGGNDTADVETPVARLTGRVDLLKVNHHGSATSTNAAALADWAPRAALISVGTDNSYCHPNPGVLSRVADSGARIFATGLGMTAPQGSCNATDWPPEAVQQGTTRVEGYADGRMFVEGEELP